MNVENKLYQPNKQRFKFYHPTNFRNLIAKTTAEKETKQEALVF